MADDFFEPLQQTKSAPTKSGDSFFTPLSPSEKLASSEKGKPASTTTRNIARSAARVGEVVAGGIGNTLDTIVHGLNFLAKKVPGGKPKSDEQIKNMTKNFPSSSNIRKLHEPYTGEYLKPQSAKEEKSDEFISDLTAILNPLEIGKKAKTGLKAGIAGTKILKDLGKKILTRGTITAGGHLAEEGAKATGASEETSQYIKLGTMFLGSLIEKNGLNGAENVKNSLYSEAKQLRPKDAKTPVRTFRTGLNDYEKQLKKGNPKDASKQKALENIKAARSKINGSDVSVEELEELKKSLNEARGSLYADANLDKNGRRMAKHHLDNLSKIYDQSINEYAKQNPEWGKAYRSANEVHGAIAESKRASNYIAKHADIAKKGALGAAVLEIATGHPGAIIPTAVGVGVGAAGIKTVELGARIWKSPTLRKYYIGALDAAFEENSKLMNYNLNKLYYELQDENNQQRSEQ